MQCQKLQQCHHKMSGLKKATSPLLAALRGFSASSCHRAPAAVASLDTLTEDELLVQQTAAKFAKDIVAPLVKEMDKARAMPRSLVDAMFHSGLMGLHMPARYGGSGASLTATALVLEEVARVDAGPAGMIQVQNYLITNGFLDEGTEEQKEKYLPMLCKDTIGSYCLSEPSSGSDAFAMKTRAEKTGDYYVLNGSKMWITNSDHAGIFTVFATEDPSKGYKGLTAFIVERDMEGFTVGTPINKLGTHCSGTCPLYFDNVKVPASNVLGTNGQGYKYIMKRLNEGRVGVAASNVGSAKGALDTAIPYLMERQQFGKRIWDFQALQHQVARLAVDIEAARMVTYNAARRWEAGQPFARQAAMAKYLASEVANKVTSKCIELVGGVGFTEDFPFEKYFRDVKAAPIVEGTNNIQLNTIASLIEKEFSE